SVYHLDLHSFPTRRSSDLKVGGLAGSFLSFADRDTIGQSEKIGVLEVLGLRQLTANNVKAATKKGRYFANCYSTGRIDGRYPVRSEEHTSELQSRENLVCR